MMASCHGHRRVDFIFEKKNDVMKSEKGAERGHSLIKIRVNDNDTR